MFGWSRKKEAKVPGANAVRCPVCESHEHMVIKPAFWSEIVDGGVVEHVCGQCVTCLACDSPFVIVAHRPGGIIKRRRVAAGVEMPEPTRQAPPMPQRPGGDANGMIDSLARELASAKIPREPD